MKTVYVNGKFLAQRATGVQRSAREWLHAVDELLSEDSSPLERWIVLHPPGVVAPAWRSIEARPVGASGTMLHLWEQWTLPRAADDGLLLSLAGSAPWSARAQIATLHDAAVWDCPTSYTGPFALWYRTLFRHLASGARRLLTVSEFSRSRLSHWLRRPAVDIGIVPNGADHLRRVTGDEQALMRLGLAGCRYVLAVASDNPSKNLARLALAVQQLEPALGIELVLVGDGNPRVFAKGEAPQGDRVRRLGPVGDPSLKALLQGALVLAAPSLYEGFGLPPLEAMDCGCPVIAGRAAALPEICGDAVLYVDPLSATDIGGAVRRLCVDHVLREELRARGLARAGRFTWRHGAELLLGQVRSVLPSS
ncbi:MAG: glycosyltransferase family 1 protein [Burkholderiaceae bacterium]